jgi:tol-pal system protein YbgF
VQAGRFLGVAILALGLWGQSAGAQDYNEPPADVPGDAQAQEGALALRIGRLEEALRRANGQIEDLQNQNRKLADDFKRFREDLEFRLSGKTGAPPPVAAAPEPTRLARKGDAFDPDANPSAPGAPKPIGSANASAPLTLSSHVANAPGPATLKPLPAPPPQTEARAGEEPTFVPSGVPFGDSKEQYRSALAAYKAGQYADAEALFKAYIQANKGAANVADAIFYIGETYMQRARPREAAEQYLKVSTDYPKSSRAPESMVRLGLALARLGNTEQACATFAEVGKRYPSAPSSVKRSADREIQAHRCS